MIQYLKTRKVRSPQRMNDTDSGIDFFLPESWLPVSILPWENIVIPLWIKITLPKGYDMTFTNRSSIAVNKWLIVWACLIDGWYQWELVLNLINISKFEATLNEWDSIVQWVVRKIDLLSIEETMEEDLKPTQRGEGKIGSTNNKKIWTKK